jgi:hypothetical protein
MRTAGGGKGGGSGGSYNPQSLLSAVCRHSPHFKGRQQHDSHELLRVLLDGLQVRARARWPAAGDASMCRVMLQLWLEMGSRASP